MNSNANQRKRSLHKWNTQSYIQRAKEVHGDKYDYSLVEYVKGSAKVKIICPTHGEFLQGALNHLSGGGCRSCFYENRRNTKESFLAQAQAKHGNKYDYSLVDYVTRKTEVQIICPHHGNFWQKPDTHLFSTHGCPRCSRPGFSLDAPHLLYLLKFQKDIATFWKIGITSCSIRKRFSHAGEYKSIVEETTWSFPSGKEALLAEQETIHQFSPYRMQFLFPLLAHGGDSECFTLKLPVHKVKSFVDSLKTQGACLLSD